MGNLTGRVALVTGGTEGIGYGMAVGLAKAGADVVLAGRTPAKGQAAVERLRQHGGGVHFIAADVAKADDCQRLVRDADAWKGRLDILVNNAGSSVRAKPQDLTDADWDYVINLNASSAFRCARAAYPIFMRLGGGKVINVGSTMSVNQAGTFAAAYAASKGAMLQLTKALAVAWAGDNIQVNAVLPGYTSTPLIDTVRAGAPDMDKHVLSRMPSKRWGRIEDFEAVAAFLAGPGSEFVVGTAITVDGGFSCVG